MKRKHLAKKGIALGLAASLCAAGGTSALAVYSPEENGPGSETVVYNEIGANQGLDPSTENAEVTDYSEEAADDYIHAGTYIVSDSPTASGDYSESGTYYEATSFEYGNGIYVIIQDPDSTDKFYTLIKSAQDLEIGDSYIYREGDIGGRLLDDKYTSTHMANNYENSEYSYVSYDTGGGKLSAQEAAFNEDGTPADEQADGFTYLYLVSETPADYYQRLANEAAGLEEKANSEDRAYMPVNNTNQTGEAFNNWANLTEDDDKNYNDKITRVGGTEGDSNTRLYSYSGQNVIVAKIAVTITEGTAELAWAESTDYDADADYSATEGSIEIAAGDSATVYFHPQYTNTWGRDGYANADITYTIGDESIISYVGASEEEGAQSYVLTGEKAGTTTLTATVNDSEGKFVGGAQITLTVTVK